MLVSQLYGMKIVQKDQKKRGYILGISCAENKIEGYICCSESESEFFADGAKAVLCKEFMTFENTAKRNRKCAELRLGRAVYSDKGKFLGHLTDCTAAGNKLGFALVGKKKYPFSRLILGDVIILKDEKLAASVTAKDMMIERLCND